MSQHDHGITRNKPDGLHVDTNQHRPASLSHTGGDYWCESFTKELRKAGLVETPDAVFPWVSRRHDENRIAVFKLTNQGRELAKKSVPLSDSGAKLPKAQLDALEAGMDRLRSQAKEADGDLKSQLLGFRLPPPDSPYYRVSKEGSFPWSKRRLVILWGLGVRDQAIAPGHPDAAAFGYLRRFEATERGLGAILRWLLIALLLLLLLLAAFEISREDKDKGANPSSSSGNGSGLGGSSTGTGGQTFGGGGQGGGTTNGSNNGSSSSGNGSGLGGSSTGTGGQTLGGNGQSSGTTNSSNNGSSSSGNGSGLGGSNIGTGSQTSEPNPHTPTSLTGLSVSISARIQSPNADGTLRTEIAVSLSPINTKITRVEWTVGGVRYQEKTPRITPNLAAGRYEVRAEVYIRDEYKPLVALTTITVTR